MVNVCVMPLTNGKLAQGTDQSPPRADLYGSWHDFDTSQLALADQKDLKPSIGRVSRLTARWSCSMRLFSYLFCRTWRACKTGGATDLFHVNGMLR